MKQGIAAAEEKFARKSDAHRRRYRHAPDTARWLVAHAEANGLVLNSSRALALENLPERVHIPASHYFGMLYP